MISFSLQRKICGNFHVCSGPVARYKELIADGVIKEDESQFKAVEKLQCLFQELQVTECATLSCI